MTCFNFKVTGSGTATPKGSTFPGAYSKDEPGFKYDVFNTTTDLPYPPVGPPLYKSEFNAHLEPKELVVVSPTGKGDAADATYFSYQETVLKAQSATTEAFDAAGG